MKIHRIYTEDVNRDSIYQILDSLFAGYTVIPATGSWEGKRENSLVVELVDEDNTRSELVNAAARIIKDANHQQAVMVTSQPVEVQFI